MFASGLLAVYIVAGFAGAPLLGRLAMRIGKHRAVMVATTGYAAALVALPFLPKADLMVGAFQMFTAGFLAAGFQVLTRAMTADVADEVRLEQGKERSGLLYAITTLTSKISGAFAVFLTFTVLDRVGYNAPDGAANTAEAVRGLEQDEAVLLPTRDGGYGLFGLRAAAFSPSFFTDIAWSTDRVLAATLLRLQQGGVRVQLLPVQGDIDTINDLRSYCRQPAAPARHTNAVLRVLCRPGPGS